MAGDEWESDPGVLFMRRVFSTVEARQSEFLERMNIHRTDGGLRGARKMALQLFERVWADAAHSGECLGEEDAADLYVCCLAKALHTRGLTAPEGTLPGSSLVRRLMGL